MSTASIKAGDMVIVTKPTPCCGQYLRMNSTFIVAYVVEDFMYCSHCNKAAQTQVAGTGRRFDLLDAPEGCEVSRLTRIDPLQDPEMHQHPEELPHDHEHA